ncbi:MAG TPA: aminotransferase class I/II-fold pyridoxal phosphate-dependent enzyme [Thermoanaerobaculia bacterium]|nr:aminotransferase class I/II-fold pyridoxal phosphate-dependent enzyme [Thermoanaerobaculia bacterium]
MPASRAPRSSGSSRQTRAVHAGEGAAAPRRPAGAAIYQTAPFVFSSTEELDRAFAAGGAEGVYSRQGNPTVRAAEEKLAALEDAEDAVAFASGLAAMSAVVTAWCASGDRVLASADLYGGTAAWLAALGRRQPEIVVETVALGGLVQRLRDPVAPAPRLVLAESPSNPLLACCDLAELAAAAGARGALVAIDNTFATPILQNPLALGADLVFHSATKYLGGHSDLTAGFAAGSRELLGRVREVQVLSGACLDPFAAFLLARGMKTLALRVERQSENAARLALYLRGRPGVVAVHYPGDDPVARRQMRAGGGMLCFEVAGGLAAAAAVADRFELFRIIPSLGGVESGVSLPALTSHRRLTAGERAKLGIGDGLIRLSVGIEGYEDLEADLAQALAGSARLAGPGPRAERAP